jgi:hypothetical protein
VLSNSHRVRARTLAKVSGKIIAMTSSVGFITQIMTRCMFSALNQKLDWNSNLNIYHKQDCIRELMLWKLNISNVKPVFLLEKESAYDIFTDASDVGASGLSADNSNIFSSGTRNIQFQIPKKS